MARTSQAVDGRESMAWLVTDMKPATGTVPAGSFGVVTAKGAGSASKLKNYELNEPFYTPTALTLGEGDNVTVFTLGFMGMATSKDLTKSKETADITMDYDEETNKTTNGQVTVSGSINGMLVTESIKSEVITATNLIKSRFGTVLEIDKTGEVKRLASDTTDKDIVIIAWNIRNAKEDELVAFTVVPVLFTSYAVSAQYNNSQTMNCSFDGSATDENNYKGIELQIRKTADLTKALPIERPVDTVA